VLVAVGKENRVREKPEAQEWFFFKAGSDAGLKAGPFSWERLLVQAQRGILELTDVVWDPNSGWKTADKVPGLFPEVVSPGVPSSFPETPLSKEPGKSRRRARVYWLSALAALVIVGGALGAYFGLTRDGGPGTVTTVTVAATQSTDTTVTASTVVGGAAVTRLDRRYSGHEVSLHVGDRVRIDLEPWPGDKIKSVLWKYQGVGIQETDSGSEVVDDAVVTSWLELQAVTAGDVTVRAQYEYLDGRVRTTWVVYLLVEE
jgi:hypothetical protein